MIINAPNSTELLQKAKENALYGKLLIQLEKDFILANIHLDIHQDTAPDHVRATLHEKIYYLIMERFSEYLNLLYIVDVPEKAFKEIEATDAVEVAEQVSFLVLRRELQKVWLKAKYS
ncbi:hypothetical protein [Costertonia aggregata]|uniref:Uncharacterized protein n=1 Tax=Costertonia aggregata TaxID=343403 RepID=A0A7H9AMD8_9FLAO|nr:hypothetical protein [Costertonia aggregata]QLG44622.1 hypothetical protein HYG79_04425 [Costertonia aggregata]